MIKTQLSLFALVLSGAVSLYAQSAKWEFGPSIGMANYMGDLVGPAYPVMQGADWSGGLFLRRNLGEAWSLRLNGLYARVKGDDNNFPDRLGSRGLSFQSQIGELSLLGEWDLRGKRRYHKGYLRPTLSPYVFGGIGAAFLMPEVNYDRVPERTPGMIADQNADYQTVVPVIPFGGGIRYDISPRTTLGLEAGFRMPFSDYIDGVSAAADPEHRDWYLFAGATVAWRFGKFKDSDGDRVYDRYDACVDMPGEKNLDGCPDTDGDGIVDEKDKCPYQRGSAGMMGCPDRDADGVADKEDRCPDDYGLKIFAGCPDKDNDSIPDVEDQCPDRYGVLYAKGCPDTDLDSIPDHLDKCPLEKGIAVNQGCPDRDTDNDGVVDRLDVCPTVAGLRVFDGCPDTDGDGIVDKEDQCPTVPGVQALKGCPEVKKEELAILTKAMTGVQFDPAKATLRKVSFPVLDNVANLLKKYPNYQLDIRGHTDSDGDDVKNLALSEARAKACLDYLANKGVARSRMRSEGFGESKPLVPNNSKANKAKNRRVEFEMKP